MRYGIIADVHGNSEAFKTVLEKLKNIDEIWSLGDLVGYGPEPNQCIELLRKHSKINILGNHDAASVGLIDTLDFNPYAQEAIFYTQKVLKAKYKEYLKKLPLKLNPQKEVTLAHGSPREPIWEYIFDPYLASLNFPHLETKICFLGHTHIPAIFKKSKRLGALELQVVYEKPIKLEPNSSYIINPGAVGQPRDGDKRASYLIFDPENLTVNFQRVSYPQDVTQEKMKKAKLPLFLIERLSYGR